MSIRFSIAGLIIFVLCGVTSPAQDFRANSDTRKTSILILKDGDWKRVKELKRNGPTFAFYEKYGRNLSLERYVSIPADRVDVDAVVDVNNVLFNLRSACSKGEAANFEIDLEGRARVIFIEMATSAVYVEDDRNEIGGCFFETPMWNDIRRRTAAAATPTPRPTRTPIIISRSESRPLEYRVVKTESYTAWVSGRFENGAKVHVVPEGWQRVEDIAKEVAGSKANRAVTVFFWNHAGEVGGLQGATYGVELIDGKVEDILVDNR